MNNHLDSSMGYTDLLHKEISIIPDLVKKTFHEVVLANDNQSPLYNELHIKGTNDLVTDCDIKIEDILINSIRRVFPNDTFISEETHSTNKNEGRVWIIDPIDGTVNFSKGIKLYGVQIALVIDRVPVYSCIYLPEFHETYTAIKNRGAFLNGNKLHVSKEDQLFHSIVSIGDFSSKNESLRTQQLQLLSQIHNRVRKIKMVGAACIDFTMLASGKTEAHIMYTSNLWDIIPGFLLAIEAGCVSNYDPTNSNPLSDYIIVANSHSLLDELINFAD